MDKPGKNFHFYEWLVSDSFPHMATELVLNPWEENTIKLQVESLEQPLRDRFGRAKIVSGKRSHHLNKKVGGSSTSDHLTCNATDVVYLDVEDQWEVFKYIVSNQMPYRQVIIYPEANPVFIHKSINIPGKPYKHEALVSRNGKFEFWVEV